MGASLLAVAKSIYYDIVTKKEEQNSVACLNLIYSPVFDT